MSSETTDYHPWATYIYAREEARARGDRRVGTEHLVLGLLREPAVADALGHSLGSARETLTAMDRSALTTVGLDAELDVQPIPMREADVSHRRPKLKEVLSDRLPFTPVAKRTLQEASRDLRRGRSIPPNRVMLEILALAPPDPAAALLDELGVDRATVRERLAV